MRRLTLSLEESLAKQFDRWTRRHRYQNRSEAFRDLLRERLQKERSDTSVGGHCVAVVSYIYNHHERQLASRLANIQHAHHALSLCTQHVHLDHDHCLETVVLRGEIERVRQFAEALIAERGVRDGQIHIVPVEFHSTMLNGQPHLHIRPFS